MTARGLAIVAALCVALAACGHYGPPVHPKTGREAEPKATAAPGALEPAVDPERDRHE